MKQGDLLTASRINAGLAEFGRTGDFKTLVIVNREIREATDHDFEIVASWKPPTKTGIPLQVKALIARRVMLRGLDSAKRS